ncbi:hypothetical protein PG988_011495 [Apiospora saccharicola]
MAIPSTETLDTDLGDLDSFLMLCDDDFFIPDFSNFDAFELDPLLDLSIPLPNSLENGNEDGSSVVPAETTGLQQSQRFRISEEQKMHLLDWISRNPEPYPTSEDKANLARITGMTVAQISSWFSRLRQRKLQRVKPSVEGQSYQHISNFQHELGVTHKPFLRSSSLEPDAKPACHDGRGAQSLSFGILDGTFSLEAVASLRSDLRPLPALVGDTSQPSLINFPSVQSLLPPPRSKRLCVETWLESLDSPELSLHGQLDLLPDRGRVATPDLDFLDKIRALRQNIPDEEDIARWQKLLDKVNMSEASIFEASSDRASSNGSARSGSSYTSLGARQGRKLDLQPVKPTAVIHPITDGETEQPPAKKRKASTPVYPCTVCRSLFSKRYQWERYETSAHFAYERWICGRTMSQDANQDCPICATGDIHRSMLQCGHRFRDCLRKPEANRTFYRRDAIKQHLDGFHCKNQKWPTDTVRLQLDDWKVNSNPTATSLVCHFCCHQPRNYEARIQHISSHFEKGMDISQWKVSSANSLTRPLGGRYISQITFPANDFSADLLKDPLNQAVINLPNADDGSSWVVCPLCNLIFLEKAALRDHCRSIHAAIIVQHMQDHPGITMRCPVCKEQDAPSIALDPTNVCYHMLEQHPFKDEVSTECPLCRCSVSWEDESYLYKHVMECITDMFVGEAETWGCHAFYI